MTPAKTANDFHDQLVVALQKTLRSWEETLRELEEFIDSRCEGCAVCRLIQTVGEACYECPLIKECSSDAGLRNQCIISAKRTRELLERNVVFLEERLCVLEQSKSLEDK